ncbi:MAG TPA: DegT/DnrJ/EryC1/StrS family aminotransferase [Sediminispirochaeta sp.]|nr:DegT/DnrJ/EryC1/StrS family aminotransferase [Sediminispirochaeta sp.]
MNRYTSAESTGERDFIPFARPSIGEEEEQAVLEVLRSGWLTTAGRAKEFESDFAAYTGAPHALAVNSATGGLHLALEALGISSGDRVITTPYTFTATAEVVRYLGAHPLFVDIDPHNMTIDPRQVEKALKDSAGYRPSPTSRGVKAIIPVHLGGYPCEMEELKGIAAKHDLKVVEDAAHAFPVRTDAGYLGCLSDVGVFSFYATKTITTGEGGMVVTEDPDIAARIRIMRLHGIDREVWNRYTSNRAAWRYDVVAPGFKYNMPDMAAALGIVQLRKAEDFLRQRRRIASRYLEAFEGVDFLKVPANSPSHGWHLFILRLDLEKLSIGRDQYIQELRNRGIGTSVHYIPLHLMSYYQRSYNLKPDDFPEALRAYKEALSLPIYPGLRETELHRVIDAVLEVGKKYCRGGQGG